MVGRTQRSGKGGPNVHHLLLLAAIACLPALFGQGCPQFTVPVDDDSSSTTPEAPSFSFTAPLTDLVASEGDSVSIRWTLEAETAATVTLLLDPDAIYGNGNEIVVASAIQNQSSFSLKTSTLAPGAYRILALINDGFNPQQVVIAPGRLLLYSDGLLPGKVGPNIVLTAPVMNLGVSQDDTVEIEFCARDPGTEGTPTS